jgi:hypothetical protein
MALEQGGIGVILQKNKKAKEHFVRQTVFHLMTVCCLFGLGFFFIAA